MTIDILKIHSPRKQYSAILHKVLDNLQEFYKMESKCHKANLKRKFNSDTNNNMADDSAEPGQNKFDIDDSVLDHAASKVVAVELNKRIPKAKENEQDPIPSDDDEYSYPDLDLDPEVIKRRKLLRQQERQKQPLEAQQQKQQMDITDKIQT